MTTKPPPAADRFLPQEVPVPRTGSQVWTTLLLTGALVVALNFACLAYLRQHPQNLGYAAAQHKWRLLRDLNTPVDWLILGDSSGLCGVDPVLVGERLGGRALNLCTLGAYAAVDDVWMLEEYLRRFPPPRAVVLVHVYDVWHRSLHRPMLTPIPADRFANSAVQPVCARGVRNQFRLWLYRYAPLDSQTKSLRTLFRGQLSRADPVARAVRAYPTGFMPIVEPDAANVAADCAAHLAFLERRPRPRLSEDNRAALQRLCELADEHALPVVIVNSPVYEALWEAPAFQRYFRQIPPMLREATAASPLVQVAVDAPPTFSQALMQNVDHVTEPAAAVFGTVVSERVRALAATLAARHAAPEDSGGPGALPGRRDP